MLRVVIRTLPSGRTCHVQPFHVCLKGTESSILCRDDEDYDVLVKIIAVSSWRKDVIVVIYTVVSNHCHVVVLASSQAEAFAFGEDIKRVYSMWFSRKYDEKGVLRRIQTSAIWLDSDWYVRNALAYVPRNALDNGCNVDEYRWSGYSAMFRKAPIHSGRPVSDLTRREKERFLHTGANLNSVRWILDGEGHLIPACFCDNKYLEQVKHDPWPATAAAAKSLQLCPTLCDLRDGSPPGSPVPGILQARTLEWVAISFSNA